jgi:hypothetical protein
VGTVKGLFLVSDGLPDGPWFKGRHVTAFVEVGDSYVVASTDPRFGTSIHVSDDGGVSWSEPTDRPIAFPESTGATLTQVWQLREDPSTAVGAEPEPEPEAEAAAGERAATTRILAGVEPAALFRSDDGGKSFQLAEELWNHPHRERWEPGGGGLGLHTILTHPDRPGRIIVGISTGGVYRSDDGGKTWNPKNAGIKAVHLPNPDTEFGQCVHKIAFDAEGPDVLWLQNHWGIYHSVDAGDHWENVGHPGEQGGVPSDFGFPIVAHPDEPGTAFVFPLESDEFRCSAEGACRVYRTSDAGKSWQPLGRGMPPTNAHLTVLRDAFDVGSSAPFPLVFGTRTGQVYASADGGENWRLFVDNLPPILCTRVLS